MRKRTRRAGVRVNLTLQLIPGDARGGDGTVSVLHATPLRASRGLALRHLTRTFDLSMDGAVFLCTPTSVRAIEGGTLVGTLVSDLAALVEGAHRVVVVPPRRQTRISQELSEDMVCTCCPASLVPPVPQAAPLRSAPHVGALPVLTPVHCKAWFDLIMLEEAAAWRRDLRTLYLGSKNAETVDTRNRRRALAWHPLQHARGSFAHACN